MRTRSAVLAAVCLTTWALSGCGKTSEGEPVSDKVESVAETASSTTATTATSSRAIPTPEADLTEPGIVSTTRTAVPAGTVTCPLSDPPGERLATAAVADPSAPRIMVALPQGWSSTPGDGDVGARLTGPDGVSATVTIVKTPLDPAAAFKKYSDDAMAASPVSSVSVLPADLCGYSGQKLLGSWADTPEQAVEFGDRIAHIWTNNGDYLVAVHVEGPTGSPDFDPFTSPIMNDFGIEIP
ncbi:putative lipoprotein LpqN [Mycolicibacterium rhodesiae NBB3]|uniref:Putative lipoprotein LpqN n=1 Tax=Mycolicibacterium rhodesiae (strain NBB3) TaxID=710685 RepID=G8RPE6_MYCRN|nr:hypothetical protein [Mycolicibacterium rhodesiae]AEV71312.1 putative lipoprotein LpqN [Mycolicibacterium rhodesiae NBB3]